MARVRTVAGIALLAGAAWLLVGRGLVNYDTLYSLVWGRDLAHGHLPDYDVSLAPTPHPLATLGGLILAPLSTAAAGGVHGEAAIVITLIGAFLAIGAFCWIVFRLGAAWINPWAGAIAALILITRRPVLDFGSRAYVDLPYLVLVLGALLVETRRARAGAPVLALLAVAGLIRPEAWLFSAAYLVYLWWGGVRDPRLVVLAAAGPVLWMAADLAVTGNPLHSLTGTRDTAETLGRVTGLQHVPTTAPRRLGEILREPVLLGAAGGLVLTLLWLRERIRLGIAGGILGLVAFSILATAGLPILGRYLLGPAAILAIFCGAGLTGWMLLPAGDRRRRIWQAFAAITALTFVAFAPGQVDRVRALRHALAVQEGIQSDMADLIRADVFAPPCRAVTVPNHRPVPLLALWLDRSPGAVISARASTPREGVVLTPATPQIARDYVLDPRDPVQGVPRVPATFNAVGGNASWHVFKRCAPDQVQHGGE